MGKNFRGILGKSEKTLGKNCEKIEGEIGEKIWGNREGKASAKSLYLNTIKREIHFYFRSS